MPGAAIDQFGLKEVDLLIERQLRILYEVLGIVLLIQFITSDFADIMNKPARVSPFMPGLAQILRESAAGGGNSQAMFPQTLQTEFFLGIVFGEHFEDGSGKNDIANLLKTKRSNGFACIRYPVAVTPVKGSIGDT